MWFLWIFRESYVKIVSSSIFCEIWLTKLVNDNKSSEYVFYFAECMMCTLTIELWNQILCRIIKRQGYNIQHSLLQYIFVFGHLLNNFSSLRELLNWLIYKELMNRIFLIFWLPYYQTLIEMVNVVSVILALSVVENRLATSAKFDCEAWRRSLVDWDKIIKCGSEEGTPIKCGAIRRLYIVFC